MNEENITNNKYTPLYTSSNDNYIPKIKTMFNKIIEKQKNNNITKISLFNIPDFDSKLLFKEIDIDTKDYINSLDLINYLKKLSVNYNEQVIRRLIQQYDKHSQFKLIYEDFNSMIAPYNKNEKEEKNNDKISDKNLLFQKILKNEFQLILTINEMISNIKNCENFITYEAFMSISNNEKNIDKNLMKNFLESKYSEEDINFLIYYLDMNNDGLITYDDFEDFFVSLEIVQNEDYNNKNKNINNIINKDNKNNIIINDDISNKIIEEKKNSIYNKIDISKKEKNEFVNSYKKSEEEEEDNSYNNKLKYQNKKYNFDIEENKNDLYKLNYNLNNININNINSEKDNIINETKEIPKNKYKDKDINEIVNSINKKIKENNEYKVNDNDYDSYLKNKYNSYQEKVDSNITEDSHQIYLYGEKINKKNHYDNKKEENQTENNNPEKKEEKYNSLITNNIKIKKYIINEQISNKDINQSNNTKSDNNIKFNNNYKTEEKRDYYYNSTSNYIKNNDIKDNSNYEKKNNIDNKNENKFIKGNIKESNSNNDFNYSNSNKELENYQNINEDLEYNNKNNNNSYNIINNEYNNNCYSSNNYSGNFSSTDYNKSDNFINENNLNNSQKNNIEQNDYKINLKELNSNHGYNIQKENIQYIKNDNKNNENKKKIDNILSIQKNTNIEIKKDINYINKNNEKNKLKELLQLDKNNNYEKDFNNIKEININENNNINPNNSQSSHSHRININGSLFTCKGNLSVKTNTKDSDKEEYKLKNDNINNHLIYEKKTELKNNEDPFSLEINPNINEQSQNDLSIEEENEIDFNIDNNNYNINNYEQKNKFTYFRDKIQNEDKDKINYKVKNTEKFEDNIPKTKIDYLGYFYDIDKNNKDKNYIKTENLPYNLNEFLEDKYKNNIKKQQKNYAIENKKIKINLNNHYLNEKESSSSINEYNYNNDEQFMLNLQESNAINHNKEYISNNNSIILFLDYTDNILKNENICYILKETLSLREDITFKELFCLFDYHQNKNISIHEFKKVCKNILSLYPTSDQIKLIFNRYDINKDEKLDLKEFLNMISPIKKEYLGILFGDKKIQKPFHSELSDKSKKILVNLMKTIILNETNYYEIREKMKNENFSINYVWNNLLGFSKNKKNLNIKEFGNFLKNNSYNLTSYEIEVIFKKFDFDKDEFISFDDFNHEFIL